MKHISTTLKHAEEHCQARGARLTDKRKRVLSGLIGSNKALSAYDLIDRFKSDTGESISATSMYRILEFLESEELIHKLNLANKYIACAHIKCSHDHGVPQFLICQNCDEVKEITIKPALISDLKKTVKAAGFQLVSPQLEMNCLCNTCAT
jgi:Fur family zinc uptake transcriptional regulator